MSSEGSCYDRVTQIVWQVNYSTRKEVPNYFKETDAQEDTANDTLSIETVKEGWDQAGPSAISGQTLCDHYFIDLQKSAVPNSGIDETIDNCFLVGILKQKWTLLSCFWRSQT